MTNIIEYSIITFKTNPEATGILFVEDSDVRKETEKRAMSWEYRGMRESINLEKTGQLIKKLISNAGYQVSDIQKYLGLSCPQPVYRWYKGKALPTVDHLHALSILLGKHMEDLIVICNNIESMPTNLDLELITESAYNKQHLRIRSYFFLVGSQNQVTKSPMTT